MNHHYIKEEYIRSAVIVKFKKLHPKAVIPTYSKSEDAGLGLTAIGLEPMVRTPSGAKVVTIKTGIGVEIPDGYVGLIFPHSSVTQKDWRLTESVGVIDSGHQGEIKVKFDVLGGSRATSAGSYELGELCAQLIIMPFPYVEVEEIK